jgi:hypothetical protein
VIFLLDDEKIKHAKKTPKAIRIFKETADCHGHFLWMKES